MYVGRHACKCLPFYVFVCMHVSAGLVLLYILHAYVAFINCYILTYTRILYTHVHILHSMHRVFV